MTTSDASASVARGTSSEREANPFGDTLPTQVSSWLRLDRDGRVTVYFGKVELGTGVQTAIAQIVADELDVAFEQVTVVQGQTGLTPDQGYTAGSQTLQSGAPPLRRAAAQARAVLLARAAQRLRVSQDRLAVRDGVVTVRDGAPSTSLTYGELIDERAFDCPVDPNVPLKPPHEYRYVGKPLDRVDVPAKVFGTFTFVQDLRVEQAWHARVVRPAAVDAKLEQLDSASIAGIPDVQIVQQGDFVAVAAPDEWRAIRAAKALKVTWSGGGLPDQQELYDAVRRGTSDDAVIADSGGVDAAAATGTQLLEATYRWPFQAHASLGASCAVADVRPDGATIWCATQGVYPLRGAIAALLGLPEDAVRVLYVEGAGCYGHNGADDVAADAALVSRAIGKPVQLQWSIADELGWEPKGPAMVMELHGALSADGRVVAWRDDVWTPTHTMRAVGEAGNLLAAQLIGIAPPTRQRLLGGDRNARTSYTFAHQRVVVHWQRGAPLRQSALRSLGGAQNTFANESFMDELAFAAGIDPIAFRLAHLDDPRARAVLEAVAGSAAWQGTRSHEPRSQDGAVRGRGVAFARYDGRGAYVAAVADCEVIPAAGTVRVSDLYVAHDCGLIVNPDGLRNQIEGNAVHAASRALKEEVRFDRTHVTSVDWETYPVLRFSEMPNVHIELIDRPDQPSLGAGEPTTTVVAPAIANAVFAACGIRLRTVPFTPSRLLS